jgi:hypothetical protein
MFTHFYLFYAFPLFMCGIILTVYAFFRLKHNAPIYRTYVNQLRDMDNLQLTAKLLEKNSPGDRELKSKSKFFKKEFYKFKTNTAETREDLSNEVKLYFSLLFGGIAIIIIAVWWAIDMMQSIQI